MAAVEIERKFLLDALPSIPNHAVAQALEQGYLPEGGRLRRSPRPDGSVVCTHTVKTGHGLVRAERERTITGGEFEKLWPRTAGRRLSKTRYRIREGGLVWEVDRYDGLDLVLAEIELPSADAKVEIPDWLAPHIVREVTDEPAYQNYELALKLAAGDDG